ncbi:hypothetical protein N473_18495 [Pseudoalteromonas luteoviolacea CPMOR-1]|uniref:Uncharacterized protein n=1 Tax=Pseudoalteromonas luteoviolacea CPMOR-1 TaxID=1365248 RepID=A0A167KD73_9GAMM|nr:hypothetical protein [Pseudoalteromonas luteoviolacea]KZN62620.1 hypothetical protein N473_18495 [Pseudoalteromonas luteoviolacea CPMOR-1]
MKLAPWLEENEYSLETLASFLGKSFYTVRSYIYGHRRVPKAVGEKIHELTNGQVTQKDLDAQYEAFNDRTERFGIVRINGKKFGNPITTINIEDSDDKKKKFIKNVHDLVLATSSEDNSLCA